LLAHARLEQVASRAVGVFEKELYGPDPPSQIEEIEAVRDLEGLARRVEAADVRT
jgi:hypothetical protein